MSSLGSTLLRMAFSAVSLTGITGNILICLIVLLNKTMKTPMNYLLCNLAISDTLLLVLFSPLYIFQGTFQHPQGAEGRALCATVTGGTLAWTCGYASAYFLVAIAVERYFAVTKPCEPGRRITKKKLRWIVAGCWFGALSWNSVGFAVWGYDADSGFCKEDWPHKNSPKIYSSLSLLVVGALPVCTMFFLYSCVVHKLWFTGENPSGFAQFAALRMRKKVTSIVLAVSVVYTLCWIPELSIFVTSVFNPAVVKGNIAYPAVVAMVTVNSAINPIIYCFHSGKFRRHLVKLLRCGRAKSCDLRDLHEMHSGNTQDACVGVHRERSSLTRI
ncbi:QRFP-like peptide receptor [Nematostella vectensis]|uniref:QRFP-like peptide receptor n=1 Tax=Nematostella vectensis TaxID=45351 RepID=UPI00207796E3|nr:QRFP-like peptide receptor [Nematostella vectensis]